MRSRLMTDEAYAEAQADLEARINEDVLASALQVRPQRKPAPDLAADTGEADDEGMDDDEDGPEVVYVHD
jgi:hypothetical protein